jgi:hypothetical protein
VQHLFKIKTPYLIAFTAPFLIHCKSRVYNNDSAQNSIAFTRNDKAGAGHEKGELQLNQEYPQEELEAKNFQMFAEYIRELQADVEKDNKGVKKRGFHSKQIACLKGTFTVSSGIDPALAKGIFKPNETYQILGRYSGGSSIVKPDSEPDVHGLSLKLLNIPGPKLLTPDSRSVDLTMTNSPTFSTKTSSNFIELAKTLHARNAGGGVKAKLAVPLFALKHPVAAARIKAVTEKKIGDLSLEPFWSGGAFRIGPDQAMKFRVQACQDEKVNIPKDLSDEHFRDTMQARLNNQDICYNFYVQLQKDPYKQPIENPQEVWEENETPSIQLATIKLTKGQQILNQADTCEQIVFHPWNTIEDHRPLGEVNRSRKLIYSSSAMGRSQEKVITDPAGE